MDARLIAWRHPAPRGASGRCIGRTDLAVDRRKTKRLAHRVRRRVRQIGWPRVVFTSPLQRCADVGRWLARWGWEHRIDLRLIELDFGHWDGQRWSEIGREEFAAWTADFEGHAPGGGEALRSLMARCREFMGEGGGRPLCVVGHAGWINAARWVLERGHLPVTSGEWPAPPRYAAEVCLASSSLGAESQ